MPVRKTLKQGEELQVPSTLFNFLFVVNSSPFVLEIEISHNDLANPVLIIKEGNWEGENIEENKALREKLKKYKGMEI